MGAALTRVVEEVAGERIELVVRDRGDTARLVRRVLVGREYPARLPLTGWNPGVIVDIGANVGAMTRRLAAQHPEAVLHAVEPSSATFRLLEHNTAALGERVRLHRCAVSDRSGTALLRRGHEVDLQHSLAASPETAGTGEEVALVRARDLIAEAGRPGILKVDTEGSELPILGDLEAAGVLATIDFVMVEWHSAEERRALDALMWRHFVPFWAQQPGIHRGTLAWINRSWPKRFPALDQHRVPSG